MSGRVGYCLFYRHSHLFSPGGIMDIFFAVLFYGTLFFLAGVGVVHIWEQETGR